jgi:hypothetical protein
MKVTTLVLNADGEPHFKSEDHFDITNLFAIAKSREKMVRDKGAEWTVGAVSAFGSEVIKAVNFGEHDALSKAIIQMLMAAWLFDSLYGGISKDQYLKSNSEFTILHTGAVAYTRIPVVTPSA